MRGKVAKGLRDLVYGDHSLKVREYRKGMNGQIVAVGHRRKYQLAKKDFKVNG